MKPDLTGAAWKKSTRSNGSGNCVEVATNLPGTVAIRDTKDMGTGPVLTFTPPNGTRSSARPRTESSTSKPQ